MDTGPHWVPVQGALGHSRPQGWPTGTITAVRRFSALHSPPPGSSQGFSSGVQASSVASGCGPHNPRIWREEGAVGGQTKY